MLQVIWCKYLERQKYLKASVSQLMFLVLLHLLVFILISEVLFQNHVCESLFNKDYYY